MKTITLTEEQARQIEDALKFNARMCDIEGTKALAIIRAARAQEQEGREWGDETDPVIGDKSQWKRRPTPLKKETQPIGVVAQNGCISWRAGQEPLPPRTKLYTTLIEPVEQEPVAEVVLRNQIIGFGRTDERKDIKFLADVDIGSKLYSVPVRTKDLTSEDIDDAYEAAGKKFKSWQQSVHGQMMSEHDFFVTYFAHELITKYKEINK